MRSVTNDPESLACNGSGASDNFVTPTDISPRGGATTPAERRLSRPFNSLMVPHKTMKKICCLGAGYVGKWVEFQVSRLPYITKFPTNMCSIT